MKRGIKMKLTSKPSSVTVGKKILTNIGNYSNIEVTHQATVPVGENEEPDYNAIYDKVNQNLQIEQTSLDASWIKRGETKDDWKLTIYLPKRKEVDKK